MTGRLGPGGYASQADGIVRRGTAVSLGERCRGVDRDFAGGILAWSRSVAGPTATGAHVAAFDMALVWADRHGWQGRARMKDLCRPRAGRRGRLRRGGPYVALARTPVVGADVLVLTGT